MDSKKTDNNLPTQMVNLAREAPQIKRNKLMRNNIGDVKKIEHKDKIKMEIKIWDLKLIEIKIEISKIREMEMSKKIKIINFQSQHVKINMKKNLR